MSNHIPARSVAGFSCALLVALFFLLPGNADAGSAFVGMQPQELTPNAMEALGLPGKNGVIVRNIGSESPASLAGLHQGDVILVVNNKNITSLKQLVAIISKSKPGDVIGLSIYRDGETLDIKMEVGDWATARRARQNQASQISPLGLSFVALTDKIREQFKIRWDTVGLAVTIVDPAKGMSKAIKRGDVIVQINQQVVWRPSQLAQAYVKAQQEGRKNILLLVLRNSGYVFTILPIR